MVDVGALKSISKGAAFVFFGNIIVKIVSYAYLLFLARFLSPFWLGAYALIITIIEGCSAICRVGLPTALVKFISVYESNKDHGRIKGVLKFSFSLSFILSIFLAAFIFLLSKTISLNIFHNQELTKPLQVFALFLPLSTIFNLFRPVFQGLKDMKDMVLMDIVQKISAFIFLLIFLFCFKTKIWAVLAAYGASLLLSALFSYLKLIAKLPLLINKNIITIISRKEIIFYAAPLFLTVVTTQVFQKVDSLMIGYFCAIKQVGLYTPASNMSFLVSFPLLVFNQIFAPIIAQYYQQGKIKELDYLFKTITRWIFMLGFAAFLFILLMNKEIMQLFGRQYIQASGVLIILACAQLVNAAAGPVSWVLSMTNNQNILATVMISSNLLNIILNVFLIPRFGLLGAAFSTGISVILLNLLNLFFVFKIIKIYPFDIKFIKPFLSGLIAFFLGFVIVNSLTIYDYRMKLFVAGVSFSFAFFILSFLFRYEKEELFMLNILKQKIKG